MKINTFYLKIIEVILVCYEKKNHKKSFFVCIKRNFPETNIFAYFIYERRIFKNFCVG